MDLEETVRELKADLKNARDFTSSLVENFKALKPGREDELHRKLDELLGQKENQNELERKIDRLQEELMVSREEIKSLKGEIQNMAEEVKNSKEMKHIIDTVETSVGYQELFVRDFERIHEKIQEIDAGVSVRLRELKMQHEELTVQHKDQMEKTENVSIKVANFEGKMGDCERTNERMKENEQNLADVARKVEKLEHELTEKVNLITKNKEETNKLIEKGKKMDLGNFKKEMDEKLREIKKCAEKAIEPNYKCWHCDTSLPKNLPFREDGVSVSCTSCKYSNVVGTLKKGHKWMFYLCGGNHYQQYPLDRKSGEKGKCQVCQKIGDIRDIWQMGIPC